MDNYIANEFEKSAYMIADDGQFFFNSNQVTKEEWLAAGAAHHSLKYSSKIQNDDTYGITGTEMFSRI